MLELIKPCKEYILSYLEFCIEYKLNNIMKIFVTDEPIEVLTSIANDSIKLKEFTNNFVAEEENNRRGIGLKKGFVPSSQYWMLKENKVIGIGNLRHYLTPVLEVYAGHIGYGIKLEQWGGGYGTHLLGLMLNEASKLDIKFALLTCNCSNVGSRRVIEKNGGRYLDTLNHEMDGVVRETHRFLIDTGLIPNKPCPVSAALLLNSEISGNGLRLVPAKVIDEGGIVISCYFSIFDELTKVGWIVFRIAEESVLYSDGNIGYFINKGYRGEHYAEKGCLLLKEKLKRLGVSVVFITADCQNKSSRVVCERLGAHLLEIIYLENTIHKKLMCRYRWNLINS